MEFRTKIPLQTQQHYQIDYQSKLLTLGSCFSEHIHKKLAYYKFQALGNPTGILFNPIAIEKLITRAVNESLYTEKDIFNHNDLWHSFEAHSTMSATEKSEVLTHLNTAVTSVNKALKSATHVIITLGTAWVFRHIETDTIVANCHKVPQKKFLKELLSITEIVDALQGIIALVRAFNPKITILFTVSPVRHIKDGHVENTRSKSHLLSAVHEVVDHRKQQFYFPSYEMMMDDLRDYRFYTSDMIHPNETAIDYIWECFRSIWLSETASKTMNVIASIQKRLSHRPFNPNTEAHQKFLNTLSEDIKNLQSDFPNIKF